MIVLSFRALDHFTTFEMALQDKVYVSFILRQVKSVVINIFCCWVLVDKCFINVKDIEFSLNIR